MGELRFSTKSQPTFRKIKNPIFLNFRKTELISFYLVDSSPKVSGEFWVSDSGALAGMPPLQSSITVWGGANNVIEEVVNEVRKSGCYISKATILFIAIHATSLLRQGSRISDNISESKLMREIFAFGNCGSPKVLQLFPKDSERITDDFRTLSKTSEDVQTASEGQGQSHIHNKLRKLFVDSDRLSGQSTTFSNIETVFNFICYR